MRRSTRLLARCPTCPGKSFLLKATWLIRALSGHGLRVTFCRNHDHAWVCEDTHFRTGPREPDNISRDQFLESEIAKLGYPIQTRQDCLNADPDNFITDALSEGELSQELRTQVSWVMAMYTDVIDRPFQERLCPRPWV